MTIQNDLNAWRDALHGLLFILDTYEDKEIALATMKAEMTTLLGIDRYLGTRYFPSEVDLDFTLEETL